MTTKIPITPHPFSSNITDEPGNSTNSSYIILSLKNINILFINNFFITNIMASSMHNHSQRNYDDLP